MKKLLIILALFTIYFSSFAGLGSNELKMVLQGGDKSTPMDMVISANGNIFAKLSSNGVSVWKKSGNLIFSRSTTGISNISLSHDGTIFAYIHQGNIITVNLKNNNEHIIQRYTRDNTVIHNYAVAILDKNRLIAGSLFSGMKYIPETIKESEYNNIYSKIDNDYQKKMLDKAYIHINDEKLYLKSSRLSQEDEVMAYSALLQGGMTLQPKTIMASMLDIVDFKGNVIRHLGTHSESQSGMLSKIVISPDNQYILSFSYDGIAKLWHTVTGMVKSYNTGAVINSVDFDLKKKIFGWSTNADVIVSNLRGQIIFNEKTNSSFYFVDLKNEFLYSASMNEKKESYITQKDFDDNILSNYHGLMSYVTKGVISDDRKILYVAENNGVITAINLETSDIVYLVHENNEWVNYTSDMYWAASKTGGRLIGMVAGFEAFHVDQFATYHNRPDIILKRLGIDNKDMIDYYYRQYLKRLRRLGLNASDGKNDYHVPEVAIVDYSKSGNKLELDLAFRDEKFSLKSYNIYVNDVPVYGSYGKPLNGSQVQISDSIILTNGENKVEISCINDNGAESFRTSVTEHYNGKTKGNLIFMGFGVSDYKDDGITDLRYAHKDVIDMAKTFSNLKKYYKDIKTYIYTDKEVTLKTITQAKKHLTNTNPEDTLILFIAGHGVHDTDDERTYYYITHNAKLDDLKNTAAPFEKIEELLQGIPPRQKLFLMDTCQSGEAEEDEELYFADADNSRQLVSRSLKVVKGRGLKKVNASRDDDYLFENDRYIFNDLLRRSGAIVFSSSKGNELSYESNIYKNGMFTYAILNALTDDKAFKNKQSLTIDELEKYVAKEVADKTYHFQNPTIDRDNIFIKMEIYRVR